MFYTDLQHTINWQLTRFPQPDILRNLFGVGDLGFLNPGYEHFLISVITNTEIKNKQLLIGKDSEN